MPLVIEAVPELGPLGHPAISIAHYGEQNGDLLRDPEMCFELSKPPLCNLDLVSYYWRNDYLGIEQWSRVTRDGKYVLNAELFRQHEDFAVFWDRNLREQGFPRALTDKLIQG